MPPPSPRSRSEGPVLRQKQLLYLHTDHLSTPRLATSPDQTVVWRWQGDAFGTTKPDKDPDRDGKKVNIRLRFPGQYQDAESGLYYNWNRYYDAKIGRYITSDPIGLNAGLNTYFYVFNNPLINNDPLGLYTAARWLTGPSLSGITKQKVGDISFGEYWTLIPPSIGIAGTWWMLNARITGTVECLDTTCDNQRRDIFNVKVDLGKRVGIGYGVTMFPRIRALRKGVGLFSTISDAIAFFRGQWTEKVIEMSRNPLVWCLVFDAASSD